MPSEQKQSAKKGALLGGYPGAMQPDLTRAKSSGGTSYVDMIKGHVDYIQEAPHRLPLLCFAGGVGVVFMGILDGFFKVSLLWQDPARWAVAIFQVLFGVVTCLVEVHGGFISASLFQSIEKTQAWMHEWAKGLTTLWGRGLFYFFQGTFALMSPEWIGVIIGIYMCILGVLLIGLSAKRVKAGEDPSIIGSPQADYIRVTP